MRTWIKIALLGLATLGAAAPSVVLVMHRSAADPAVKAARQPVAEAVRTETDRQSIVPQTVLAAPVAPLRATMLDPAAEPARPELAAAFEVLPAEADAAAGQPAAHPDIARVEIARIDPALAAVPPEQALAVIGTRLAVEAAPKALDRAALEELVRAEARRRDVPEDLALAVVGLASGWDPQKKGDGGRLGLTQVTLSIARSYLYRGDAAGLMRPDVNVQYGLAYVAGARRKAGRDLCRTAMKIAGGHYVERMTPDHQAYCDRLKSAMAEAAPIAVDKPAPETPAAAKD